MSRLPSTLSLFLLLQCSVVTSFESPRHASVRRHRHLQQNQSSCGRYSDTPTTATVFPLRIQAEDYCDMQGIAVEDTDDTGTDQNVGWIDFGDWMAYDIYLPQEGYFLASFRVASPDGVGALQVVEWLQDDSETSLQKVWSIPSTGGWLMYETIPISSNENGFYLSAGWHTIVIRARSSGFNLDWFELLEWDGPIHVPVDDETNPPASGFVRASGKSIIDPLGENLLLRGMGFGGWMVQEPYMMLAVDGAEAQHDMFRNVQDLVGPSNFETYRQAWLDNYCTIEDVQELKAAGFNSLRVPLHYNLFTLPIEQEPVRGSDTWLTEGFERLDTLLQWCKEEEVYLILDLHAAPGGQGRNSAINDYDDSKPSMWEDSENVRKAIALWVEFAKRYSDEPWVAGYDLINEPNWNFEPGHPNGCDDTQNAPLKAFYDQAIAAIRQVDGDHMIIIEGNCWANNHNGLWPMNDDNVVLSFHRYWIENTVSSIQQFLNLGDQNNVPLWMGESGENDDLWYREAVSLLESLNIGWAWWTWKKMESTSGSFSIRKPSGYQSLLDYWAGRSSSVPAESSALDTMMQLASNARLENVVRNSNAISALTSSAQSCGENTAAVLDTRKTVRVEAETYCSMFGIASEETADAGGGYNVGWIDPGDWLSYSINVPVSGLYTIEYRVSSLSGDGMLELVTDDDKLVGEIDEFPVTNDWQTWETVSHTAELEEGTQTIRVVAMEPGWNFNWMQVAFESLTNSTEAEPTEPEPTEPTEGEPTDPTAVGPTEPTEGEPTDPTEAEPTATVGGEPTEPVESGLQGSKSESDDKSFRRPFLISLVAALLLAIVLIALLAVLWRMRQQFNSDKLATMALPVEPEPTDEHSESQPIERFESQSVVTPKSADVYVLDNRSSVVSSQGNTAGSQASHDEPMQEDLESFPDNAIFEEEESM